MIRLSACYDKECMSDYVFYKSGEKEFSTFPDVKSDIVLIVSYIQIGFNADDMCSNQIFGLAPQNSWNQRVLHAPVQPIRCALKLDEEFDYGAWRVDRGNEWKYFYDSKSQWFCVGNPDTKGVINVNFLDNAIATLDANGGLQALWILPIFKQ